MSEHIDLGYTPQKGDDCVDLILDGDKGDFTVRPCRPSLRPLLEAEREKLTRYGASKSSSAEQPDQSEQP
jgi:hypothetical protein